MDTKLSSFMAQTGVDSSKAKEFLQSFEGSLPEAVKSYRLLQAALPPSGPQKNINGPPMSKALEKRLKRGISKSVENSNIVIRQRELILQDIHENGLNSEIRFEWSKYTFMLPDTTSYPEDLRAFLHKELIETSTLVSLEQAGRLNWWADIGACQRLLPFATTGDGNCLLHAASLGMWGFHDRELTLRKVLHHTLQNCGIDCAMWRRWRWQQTQVNKQSGLILSEEEWCADWNYLRRQSSAKPRSTPGSVASCCDSPATKGLMERTNEEKEHQKSEEVFYESLEEFHVFMLAHILRRPIVIVADTILRDADGGALAPIPFGGIYLPLECEPADCHRTPLLLTYDAAHFSALVTMKPSSPADTLLPLAIPLVDPCFELLHIHFVVDPGPDFVWGRDLKDAKKTKDLNLSTDEKLVILRKYLDIAPIPIPRRRSSDECSDELAATASHRRSSSFSGALVQNTSSSDSTDACLSSAENLQAGAGTVTLREKSNTLDGKLKNSLKDYSNSDGGKTGKAEQRSRVAKQLSKSFGSLGRSVSKKLKKMGKLNLNGGGSKDAKRSSLMSVTQSTKVNHTASLLQNKERVLAAQIELILVENYEVMVDNYMHHARERFEQDKALRRQQDVEMRQKAEERKSLAGLSVGEADDAISTTADQSRSKSDVPVDCINKECTGQGSAETSYLCATCLAKQKQQERDGASGATNGANKNISQPVKPKNPNLQLHLNNSYEKCRSNLAKPESTDSLDCDDDEADAPEKPVDARLLRQNTMIETGKSKFYTLREEDQSLNMLGDNERNFKSPPVSWNNETNYGGDKQCLNNAREIQREHNATGAAPTIELARSSFYVQALGQEARAHALRNEGNFVNNLHNEWQEKGNMNQRGKCYSKQAPLSKEYTNEVTHAVTGASPTHKQAPAQHGSSASGTATGGNDQSRPSVRHGDDVDLSNHVVTDQDRIDQYQAALQQIQPKTMAIRHENLAAHVMPAKAVDLQKPCKESGCPYFGTIATDFYCTACFKRLQKELATKTASQRL